MYDEPDRRAEIDASLRDVYDTLFITASPTPVKAALNLLGHDAGHAAAADGRGRRGRDRRRPRDARAPRPALRGVRSVSGTLRVLPLGGVGEIGKNMTVVEYDGRIVLVDAGLRFPTAEQMGIDLVLPDFAYLRDRTDDIEAIVITHGHEDHLGCLPWLLRELGEESIPVTYGGQLTVAMARSKLDEHKLRKARLDVLPTGEPVQAGPFTIEMIHLTHSIPDACGVALTTELGTILFTGDYKFDQTPVGGAPADVSRLAELGPRGPAAARGRLHERRPPGLLHERVDRRPEPRARLPALRGPDRRHLLRVEHPPRAAGRRRGGGARPQGRARRALDAQEREHRALAGPHQRARGHARAAARGRPVGRREARDRLHGLPGRAAVGAAPDGLPRPPAGRAAGRRHGRLLRHADPGQRARGQRDDRPALPRRRRGDHHARRADPRLRPRVPGGDQADAQPHAAALRDARARRLQAPAAARQARRGGRRARGEHLPHRERPAAGDRRARAPASASASRAA